MEQVSVAVKAALDKQKVPIKYWQWDGKSSGPRNCVACSRALYVYTC